MNKLKWSIFHSQNLALVAVVASALLVSGPGLVSAQIEISVDPTTGSASQADADAVKAASSIVAPAGAPMASTEFTSTQATAPTPPEIKPVTDAEIQKAAKDGADLIRILGLVPTTRGPEPLNAQDRELFEQEEKARELLGDNPTVVYRIKFGEETLPDPMIVPWIEQASKLKDRFEQAVNSIAANKLSEARSELLAISTEFPDSEWGIQSALLLKKLENLKEGQTPVVADTPKTPEIVLDGPVKPTTILFDASNPDQSRVMILGRAYKVGQAIRQHPDHIVKAVRPNEIDIEVSRNNASKVFTIPVRQNAGQ